VIRDAINSRQIPGPRYVAASQEITVTGSLETTCCRICRSRRCPSAAWSMAPRDAEGRAHVPQYGVDQVKLNLSGDNLVRARMRARAG